MTKVPTWHIKQYYMETYQSHNSLKNYPSSGGRGLMICSGVRIHCDIIDVNLWPLTVLYFWINKYTYY